MKVAVKVKNLLKAVNICSRLVNNRNALEVLGNILIQTDKNTLRLSSTNLDLAVTTSLGAKVEKEGKLSVPARLFSELIGSISEETLQLIADEEKLIIKGEKVHSRLNGVAASEFPSLPKLKDNSSLELKSQDLKALIEKTVISVSGDESRPVLAGILLNIVNGKLSMAATDSYRLSEVSVSTNIKGDIDCIIPARTITELQRLISIEEADKLQLKISESEASFLVGESELITQLTDGKYPDYRKIIPSNSKTTLECEVADLQEAVKVSSVFARESSHAVNIKSNGKELTLSAQTSDIGENTFNVAVQQSGENAEISINAKYLSDVLSVIGTSKIQLLLNGKLDPLLLKPNTKKEELYIIMPLRS